MRMDAGPRGLRGHPDGPPIQPFAGMIKLAHEEEVNRLRNEVVAEGVVVAELAVVQHRAVYRNPGVAIVGL